MDSGRATVRNMRSKCRCSYVLQFTFRRAVCCVLHRPPSQVIHCTVSFFNENSWPTSRARSASHGVCVCTVNISSRGGEHQKPMRRRSSLNGWLSPDQGSQRGTVPSHRPPLEHGEAQTCRSALRSSSVAAACRRASSPRIATRKPKFAARFPGGVSKSQRPESLRENR